MCQSQKVTIYTTDDCVECNYVKKTLEEEGIPFDVRNISGNEQYQIEVEKFGYMGVPVTVVGDKAVKGFTLELVEVIENYKKVKEQ